MMSWDCTVIVSGNGLLPGLFDAKPIPEPILAYYQYFPLGKSFQEISNQIIKKSRSRKYMQKCSLQSVGHASKDLVVQPGNAHDLQVAIYEIQGPWYRHESRRLGADTTITWWRHEIETFSALLALCEVHPPLTGGFPSQSPVTQSFEVFFDQTVEQTIDTPVIWDAIAFIMMSL